MTRMHPALAAFAALALSACGGSSSTANPPPPGATQASKGVITAKGSIFVNGVEFDVSSANITIEGVSNRPEAELKVGMVVKVKGSHDDRTGEAQEVEFEDDLRGKVDDKGSGILSVGGHEVEVDDSTEFEDGVSRLGSVSVGERVRVSGFARPSGAIRATRIEKEAGASEDFEVKGFVSGLAMGPPATFTLKVTPDAATGYAVTLAAGVALPAGVQNGSFVEVRSLTAPVAGAITASAIQLEDARLGEENDEVEVEGMVSSGDSTAFVVDGQAVSTGASTTWENGVPADLVPGVKVEAEGRLDASGTLIAKKVSFRSSIRLQSAVANLSAQDARNGTFQLLGITVHTDGWTEFKEDSGNPVDLTNLGPGPVLVRGVLHRNGVDVLATRVEKTNDSRLILQGTATAKNAAAGTLTVLGITVQIVASGPDATELGQMDGSPFASADAFFAAVAEGRTVVKARGKDAGALSAGVLTADQVEIEGSR